MTAASPQVLSLARVGDGPEKVVLLHGFLGSGRNLSTLARRWSASDPSLTLLIPDLTGHGVSPPLPPNATLEDLASDLLATIEVEAGVQPVHLVGHSLGGRVALVAASLAPSRVRSITLLDIAPGPLGHEGDESDRIVETVAAAPDFPKTREEARQFLLDRGLRPAIVEWVLTNLVSADGGYRWRIDRRALADFRKPMSLSNLWPVLEKLDVPVHCIRGGDSRYVSDSTAELYRQAGVSVDTIDGAGHFIHIDKPRELLEILKTLVPGPNG